MCVYDVVDLIEFNPKSFTPSSGFLILLFRQKCFEVELTNQKIGPSLQMPVVFHFSAARCNFTKYEIDVIFSNKSLE